MLKYGILVFLCSYYCAYCSAIGSGKYSGHSYSGHSSGSGSHGSGSGLHGYGYASTGHNPTSTRSSSLKSIHSNTYANHSSSLSGHSTNSSRKAKTDYLGYPESSHAHYTEDKYSSHSTAVNHKSAAAKTTKPATPAPAPLVSKPKGKPSPYLPASPTFMPTYGQ